jgi:tetratricopeptide (TPR) repeat protein
MTTSKKKVAGRAQDKAPMAMPTKPRKDAQQAEAYEVAVREYGVAIDLLRKGDYAQAKERFDRLATEQAQEAELAERSRTYAVICERRLPAREGQPLSQDERYYQAVMLSNGGRWNEAIKLLDQNLHAEPNSAKNLYARASAWALQGRVEAALADLRQAMGIDPGVRFQAANDPDFEKIREEPAFIDIIEPTPAGA